jgi:hypothetical protein
MISMARLATSTRTLRRLETARNDFVIIIKDSWRNIEAVSLFDTARADTRGRTRSSRRISDWKK